MSLPYILLLDISPTNLVVAFIVLPDISPLVTNEVPLILPPDMSLPYILLLDISPTNLVVAFIVLPEILPLVVNDVPLITPPEMSFALILFPEISPVAYNPLTVKRFVEGLYKMLLFVSIFKGFFPDPVVNTKL